MSKPSRRNRSGALAAAVLAAALGVTTACSSSDAAGASGPIKIGGTLGLTGALAAPSAEYKAIYEMWADSVNKHGGLLGRKVEMDIKNDNSTAATAATQYQALLTKDRADLLLAPYATFVGAAVVPIVKSSGKLLFNGGFPDSGLADSAGGRMIDAYPYQPQDYSRGLFEALAQVPATERPASVAILTNNNPFTLVDRDGYQGKGGARRYAEQAGLKVAYDETYASDTADFTGAVSKAKASGADLFVILGLPEDSLTILKTMKAVGYQPKLVCACGSQVITLPSWGDLGSAAEHVAGATGSWPTQDFQGMDELTAFSKSRGEKVIPAYAAVAYASLQVLQQAVEGAKSLDQDALKRYVYGHTFKTVVGDIDFEDNGTAPFRQVLLQTQQGEVRPVWPADVAESKLQLTPSAH